jgi:hypothetical protein
MEFDPNTSMDSLNPLDGPPSYSDSIQNSSGGYSVYEVGQSMQLLASLQGEVSLFGEVPITENHEFTPLPPAEEGDFNAEELPLYPEGETPPDQTNSEKAPGYTQGGFTDSLTEKASQNTTENESDVPADNELPTYKEAENFLDITEADIAKTRADAPKSRREKIMNVAKKAYSAAINVLAGKKDATDLLISSNEEIKPEPPTPQTAQNRNDIY